MSILYINSGYKSLFKDFNLNCYEGENEKFAKCKKYIVPLDHKNWSTVYSNEKVYDWYVRFNIYTNLSNKPYQDYEGFLRISSLAYDLTLSIDSMGKLVLSCNEWELCRFPFEYDQINSYELHLYSKPNEKEIIELKCGDKLIYKNKQNTIYNYFKNAEPYRVQIKNIVYLPNEDNYRFGMALSNFIIGDSPIGDLVVEELETDKQYEWNKKGDYYQATEEGKEVIQNIKDMTPLESVKNNDEILYAVAVVAEHAKTDTDNTKLSFGVNDYDNNEEFLSKEFQGYEGIMEIAPIEGVFWDYTNVDKDFKIKSGGYT